MEIDVVSTLIGTMGFPIVAYLLMFFKLDKSIEKLESSLKELISQLGKNHNG